MFSGPVSVNSSHFRQNISINKAKFTKKTAAMPSAAPARRHCRAATSPTLAPSRSRILSRACIASHHFYAPLAHPIRESFRDCGNHLPLPEPRLCSTDPAPMPASLTAPNGSGRPEPAHRPGPSPASPSSPHLRASRHAPPQLLINPGRLRAAATSSTRSSSSTCPS